MPGDSLDALTRIERMLHERIGLDPTTVGSSLVHRAVARRAEACGAPTVSAYAARLASDAQEVLELVEEVVIPETYFFREPEALEAIAARAVHGDTRATSEDPMRILSAPCSTGEEPYSIAMTLLAAGVAPDAMTIDALDISREALRKARAGVYRGGSFRGMGDEWRRFFTDSAGAVEVRADVRSMVRFQQANLLDEGFRAPREAYDVIFCRNLLIYFDVETQLRVLTTLTALLAPNGVLVVGAADTFAVRRAGFVPVLGSERSFLFQHAPGADAPPRGRPERSETRGRPERSEGPAVRARRAKAGPSPVAQDDHGRRATQPARPERSETRGRPERSEGPVSRFAKTTAGPSPVAQDDHGQRSALSAEIARLANAGRLKDAIHLGESALGSKDADAELLATMGTAYGALGDDAHAESCYRRALYLDPSHTDALLHLAAMLDQRGEKPAAARLRARARRGLAASVEEVP